MINHFLARLDNSPEAPGGIYWPNFTPRIVGQAEQAVRDVIIGAELGRYEHFLRCVQLTYLVANSPFAEAITARDPRVTYSTESLRQFFAIFGTVVRSFGTSTAPRLVFGTSSTTPEIFSFQLEVLSAAGGNGTLAYSDDRGYRTTLIFTYVAGDVSSTIQLPFDRGTVTFFGGAFVPGDRWLVVRQGDIQSWINTAVTRLSDINASSVLDTALLRKFNTAPLAIDKLAAVVVGLGDKE